MKRFATMFFVALLCFSFIGCAEENKENAGAEIEHNYIENENDAENAQELENTEIQLQNTEPSEAYQKGKEVGDKLKDKLENIDWGSYEENEDTEDNEKYSDAYQKGKELNEKLTEKLESIDWEENYQKAEDAGRKLAQWLNGD